MKLNVGASFIILFVLLLFQHAKAQVRLPRLVRDSMILQRDANVKLWGRATPKERIVIKFKNKRYKTITDSKGTWEVTIPPMSAGGPFTMEINASNRIVIKDILIGDVWLCSGQSNMVHQLNIHDVTYASEIATANYPQIRQFLVPTAANLKAPQDDIAAGFWKAAVGEDVRPFSAVAYFFAKKLYQKYHVPIGLINASVGGTPIEAWISEEGLKMFPATQNILQKNKDTSYVSKANRNVQAENRNNNLPPGDKGLTGNIKWFDNGYIAAGWHNINVPGYWADQGIRDLNGVVWYRKEINVPASMTGGMSTLFLGRIVDADVVYMNGTEIGKTSYLYPQRRYKLPAGTLKSGKNIIVVRVTNFNGKGGFVPDKPYCLFSGKDTVDLKGTWQYKVGEVFEPHNIRSSIAINPQNEPASLYNGMISPLINFSLKGFLWYQGESNTSRAEGYAALQAAQISDWRNKFKQPDLPFLFVQLPNFMESNYLPSESQWAALREAQLRSLAVPNTGMAVAIDLGEWNDIHPDNKKDVGERLALVAEKLAYREDIVYSGPVYVSDQIDGNRIIVSFSNTGSGLTTNNGEMPASFAIAGADKKFVWAVAIISGDKIIVSSDKVAAPKYVRYAWADNPEVNLYNKEGLPASPFRTDK